MTLILTLKKDSITERGQLVTKDWDLKSAAWRWNSMLGLGSLWLHLGQALGTFFGTSTKCVKHCSLRTPDICLEFAMF